MIGRRSPPCRSAHQSVLPVSDVSRSTLLVNTSFNQHLAARPDTFNLAHVRNVKSTNVFTNSLVFVRD